MESERRQIPTEELMAQMLFSWVSKNRHFYNYPELGRRFIVGGIVSIFVASNLLVRESGKAGRALAKSI